jgi:hypothetical protein
MATLVRVVKGDFGEIASLYKGAIIKDMFFDVGEFVLRLVDVDENRVGEFVLRLVDVDENRHFRYFDLVRGVLRHLGFFDELRRQLGVDDWTTLIASGAEEDRPGNQPVNVATLRQQFNEHMRRVLSASREVV